VSVPDPAHRRPEGLDDATLEALGKVTEALEIVEEARGHLYAFHRLTGTADLALSDSVELLRKAGHRELAERIDAELVGRDVIPGHWTFQIIEGYDDTYYGAVRDLEKQARDQLAAGRRHIFHAEMKEDRRTYQAGDGGIEKGE
jgi:hypothetical protein